jgi:pyruvate-formate lyase-activating enzyme
MDAANVDLKAFTEDFYVHQCGAHLAPVLDTLYISATKPRCGSRSPPC